MDISHKQLAETQVAVVCSMGSFGWTTQTEKIASNYMGKKRLRSVKLKSGIG